MNQNNYLQVGERIACGHCDPKRFGEGLKIEESLGRKCDCICHKEGWEKEFDERFVTDYDTAYVAQIKAFIRERFILKP